MELPRVMGDNSGPDRNRAENTEMLLALARGGDGHARDRLFGRYLPILRRLAHQRRPGGAHNLHETDDLVQDTLLRAFRHLDSFEYQREGAFLAYLRQILMNAIRDSGRQVAARPGPEPLGGVERDLGPSPLEEAIGREAVERVELALNRIDPDEREAVILRVEFGMSNQEIAVAMGKPSADAARVAVARALLALAGAMRNV